MQVYDYIDKLNERYGGGKFLKAAILTETLSPLVKKYFVHHERSITFDGNVYQPLNMHWPSVKNSSQMSLGTTDIVVSNLADQISEYTEEIDISGNPVTLQILHLDLLATLTQYWERHFFIRFIRSKPRESATIVLGRNIGLEDELPRRVMTKEDFPGLIDNVVHIL